MRRLVKREKELLAKQLSRAAGESRRVNIEDVGEIENSFDLAQLVEEEREVFNIQAEVGSTEAQVNTGDDSNTQLKNWYLKHKPKRSCAVDLIKILNKNNLKVKPFYKFNCSDKADINEIGGGSYLHIGLSKQLNKLNVIPKLPDILSIDVNIDGLPLINSSRSQLWPILIRVKNVNKCPILPIGVFSGHNKPLNSEEFLSKFTSELSDIVKNGLTILNKKIDLELRAIVCDAPARAFVTGTPGHTSSHGCSKCIQVAHKVDSVLTYSTTCADLITDEDFLNRKYRLHHNVHYISAPSALEKLGVLMVTQVPLDCMHLVELGVMRKF